LVNEAEIVSGTAKGQAGQSINVSANVQLKVEDFAT
jgi:hypothetical protein